MMLDILQIICAVATILTGLVSLLFPRKVTGFTGLEPRGGRGITEIRSVLGAFFVALGAAPLYLRVDAAFTMLGIAYLAVGAVRAISMLVDRSVEGSNVISLVVEIVFGVILIL
jgi:hypothetical protein